MEEAEGGEREKEKRREEGERGNDVHVRPYFTETVFRAMYLISTKVLLLLLPRPFAPPVRSFSSPLTGCAKGIPGLDNPGRWSKDLIR